MILGYDPSGEPQIGNHLHRPDHEQGLSEQIKCSHTPSRVFLMTEESYCAFPTGIEVQEERT